MFLLTLSVSVLLVGTGLTFVAIQQSDRRLQQNVVRTDELGWYARAGLDMAMAYMEQAPTWRTLAAANSGTLFADFPVGDGKVTVQVYDDTDSLLADSEVDPVRIRVTGKRDTDTYKLEAQLRPRPHSALKYALFGTSASEMEFKANVKIQGPVRSHGVIKATAGDVVRDDATFETMAGYTIEDPLTPKSYATTAIAAPAPDLTFYTSQATVIYGDDGARCDVAYYNLTPSVNSEGTGVNAKGIYWLQAGGREVRISYFHLKGTLIITGTGGNVVTFVNGFWLEPGPDQYPVLLVDNSLNVVDLSPAASLNEATLFPYLGWSGADLNGDGDPLDVIPSQVRGLIWTNATRLYLRNAGWMFMGCAINGRITLDNGVTIDNDLTLLDTPFPGFVASGMTVVSGSIREVQ